MIYLLLLLLVILIIFSAFFSSAETSFLSLSRITLRTMQKNHERKADKIAKVKSDTDKLLTTILIGNNLVNNLASSIATVIAVYIAGNNGIALATVIMTAIIVTFGEILPKTIASLHPVKTAQQRVDLINLLEKILFPLSWSLSLLSRSVRKLIERLRPQHTPLVTEEELKTLIDVGKDEGTLEQSEREMMYKIFEFTDLRVRDITRHRSLVQSLPFDASYNEAITTFAKSGYSRLPVFNGDFDSIIGLVHYKDLLFSKKTVPTTSDNFLLKSIIRPALFVPETKTALSLLHSFKTEKENFAIVVDEHGTNSGIVTMDDLLNAVFGRITDEYTTSDLKPEDRITIITTSDFIVPGDMMLTDVNNLFRFHFESDYYDTFGGWLLEQFGHLPLVGESLSLNNWKFIVVEQSQRRIRSVRLQLEE